MLKSQTLYKITHTHAHIHAHAHPRAHTMDQPGAECTYTLHAPINSRFSIKSTFGVLIFDLQYSFATALFTIGIGVMRDDLESRT